VLGDGEALLFGFDGAGAAVMARCSPPTEKVTRGVGNAPGGGIGFTSSEDEFVGVVTEDTFDHAEGFEYAEVDGAVLPVMPMRGGVRPGMGVGFQAERFDFVRRRERHLFVRGVG